MHRPATRANGQRTSYKKQFSGPTYNAMNFQASQIPDSSLYMDFNDPTPISNSAPIKTQAQQQPRLAGQRNKKAQGGKNKQGKNKQLSQANQQQLHQQQQQQLQLGGNNNNKRNWQINNFNGPLNDPYGFKPLMGGVVTRGRPMPLGGPRGRPPLPPLGPPHGFQPRLHGGRPPPMAPMGRGGMPPPVPLGMQPGPPPPFMRRNGRGPMPMPPRPLMPPMLPLPPQRGIGRGGMPPPMPFGNGGGVVGKIKKPNAKVVKKVIKSKSTIKTLKNIVNQYPLDKPWVTDELRVEHEKKIDIENRLKGNKNDELFAQFKVQRDKFVALYEKSREEFLKQEATAVKIKEANNKDKVNQTTEPDGNCSNEEAISN